MPGTSEDWVVVFGIIFDTLTVAFTALIGVKLYRRVKPTNQIWNVWYSDIRPRWGLPLHGRWFEALIALILVLQCTTHTMAALRPIVTSVDGQNLQVVNFISVSVDPTAYDVAYILFLIERITAALWITQLFGNMAARISVFLILLDMVVLFVLLVVCLAGVWGPISILLAVQLGIDAYMMSIAMSGAFTSKKTLSDADFSIPSGRGYGYDNPSPTNTAPSCENGGAFSLDDHDSQKLIK